MTIILVLDLGSSSTRAIAFDEHARPVPDIYAREPVGFSSGQPGQSEDDSSLAVHRARSVLVTALAQCAARGITHVDAVAIDAYAGSLIALDQTCNPITPVLTYADTRAATIAMRLREQWDELADLQRTGARTRANYAPARLAWWREIQPDLFDQAATFVSLPDLVRLKLFGSISTSLSLASWNGLIDRQSRSWDATWLDRLSIRSTQMPVISEALITLSGLSDDLAALEGAQLIPAIGDGAAANLGSGCVDASNIAVTIGTTAAMRIMTKTTPDILPNALWQYQLGTTRSLTGGALSEGGNVVAWLRDTMNLPNPQTAEAALQAADPDAHGLTILPLIAGERSPGYSDTPGATVHGIVIGTTALQMQQAWMEAVALRLALVSESLKHLAAPGAQLIASGGALYGSPTWCQMIADACDRQLHVCEEPEATARGAAIHALEHLGVVGAVDQAPLGRIFSPDAARSEAYRKARDRQIALYNKLHLSTKS